MPADRFGFDGLTAVVTGACGVVGRALVAELDTRGAHVVAFDLDDEVERLPGARGVRLDVTDEGQVRRAIETHLPEGGDILVNNAGINDRATPFDVSMATWDRIMDINLRGYFLVARAFAARCIAAGRSAAIVNVSSTAAGPSLGRGNLVYGLSKAAVNQLTRELAVEWAASGIRVNAVQPAQIETPGWIAAASDPERATMHRQVLAGIPMGRLVAPEELVGPILFLASAAASAVTGSVLPVDGGNMALNAAGTVGLPLSP